jgi:hypothetical protein
MPNAKRIFFAPRDSEAHKLLMHEAGGDASRQSALKELLCVMNADPDLIAFPTACRNLEGIIGAVQQYWNAEPRVWGLDRYENAISWVESTRDDLRKAAKIGYRYDPRPITGNAMLGNGVDRHPLYSLLLSSHANPTERVRFQLLQAHVLTGIIGELRAKYPSEAEWKSLIGAYEAYEGRNEWKPIANSIRDVCLSVRKMALALKPYDAYFRLLPVELPPKQFASEILKNTTYSSEAVRSKWLRKRHKHLRIFLRKIHGDLRFEARPEMEVASRHMAEIERERSEIATGLVRRHLTLGDQDDPFLGGSSSTQLARCKRKSLEEIRLALGADDDPFAEDGTVDDTYDTSQKRKEAKPRQLSGWYQLQPILMHNQSLPLDFASLSPAEAREFVEGAESWLHDHSTGRLKGGQCVALRLKIMQLTMLATGSSPERAQKLLVFPPGAHERWADISLLLPDDPSKVAMWRLAVINLLTSIIRRPNPTRAESISISCSCQTSWE